jgi:protein-L-isoaspartate(D-aspartate) O-methyltransferase
MIRGGTTGGSREEEIKYKERRKRMVELLIQEGRIYSPEVIRAMEEVPRHLFVPEAIRDDAYIDTPLSIGEGQTISAPHMVGIMVEALDLKRGHKVLEVGGGSGYHAAVVGVIVGVQGHVYSVEYIRSLVEFAKNNLRSAGLAHLVTMIHGDGSKGLPKFAPYDRIFVACAAPGLPKPLVAQLKDGGKMLIPVGGTFTSDLILCEKHGNKLKKTNLGGCAFVPMRGEYGY